MYLKAGVKTGTTKCSLGVRLRSISRKVLKGYINKPNANY